jgi:hypothetical protein
MGRRCASVLFVERLYLEIERPTKVERRRVPVRGLATVTRVTRSRAGVLCPVVVFAVVAPSRVFAQTAPIAGRRIPRTCAPLAGSVSGVEPSGPPQTLMVPLEGCRIELMTPHGSDALPSETAKIGWRVLERSQDPGTLVRIELRARRDAPGGNDLDGEFLAASDVARADQQLLVPSGFGGWLEMTRLDLREPPAPVVVTLMQDALGRDPRRQSAGWFVAELGSTGHAFRKELDWVQQEQLISLANNYRSREEAKPASKLEAFRLMSDLLGRRVSPAKIDKATESEPMVVFLGISGLNRVILLDCVSRLMPASKGGAEAVGCHRLSEPWQTTFERASHFWAAYVEDEQTGFDTSIDVEFTRESHSRDYDDFDPLNSVRDTAAIEGTKRRVRVGYRRFAIPARQDVVRITFSRQGAAYGLRSWSREYTRYGRWPIQFAGGMAIPGWFLARREFSLHPVFGADPINPVAVELSEDRTKQPIFAVGFVRFPPFRAAAEQANGFRRMLVPDIAYGIGLPWIDQERFGNQTLLAGGSWQVGFGSRFHFLAAVMKTKTVEGDPPIGRRFPLGTTLDSVRTVKNRWLPLLGFSVDIARTP